MNKRVVYTAIFGDYDSLLELKYIDSQIDYICFTDNKDITSRSWRIVYVEANTQDEDRSLLNRKYKFLPHIYLSSYDESLYIDGNISIESIDLSKAFDHALKGHYISIPKHVERDCIYSEADVCISLGKGDPIKIKEQMAFYKKECYPTNNGLFENNIIFRRHNCGEVIELMRLWYESILTFSGRDQLSLCYLFWKCSIYCYPFPFGPKKTNRFFKIHLHKNENNLPILKRLYLYSLINKNIKWYFKFFVYLIAKVKK